MERLFTAHRVWLLLALGSVAIVVISLVLTSVMKLHPCYLCVFQRSMFLLIAVFAATAALARIRAVSIVTGMFMLLCAAAGAGVAAYQVWLQAQPGAEFMCAGGDPNLIELVVEWLDRHIPVLFKVTGVCASKELVIFNVSLAGWAFVGFLASLMAGAWALWRGRSK